MGLRACSPSIQSRLLLRHLKTTLCWQRGDGYRAVLATASRAQTLYELDASGCGLVDPSHWSLVLGSPSMQHLRVLRTDSRHPGIIKEIVNLPHLNALYMLALSDGDLGLLSHAPSLTTLHIHDTGTAMSGNSSRLARVAACGKLTELSVYWPSLYGSSWTIFFAFPRIQQLRSLKLDRFDVGGAIRSCSDGIHITKKEWLTSITGMRHLHTLHLANCDSIDVLVLSLAYAPVLRKLIIDPTPMHHHVEFQTTKTAPSALVLAKLLMYAPRIRCVFIVRSNEMMSLLQKRFESHAALATVHYINQPPSRLLTPIQKISVWRVAFEHACRLRV